MTGTLASLAEEYQATLDALGLPQESADELLHRDLTDEQRHYVSDFYNRWTAIEDEIAQLGADIRALDTGMDLKLCLELDAEIQALEGYPREDTA